MPGTATTEGSEGRRAVLYDLSRSPTRTDTTVAANLPESRRYRGQPRPAGSALGQRRPPRPATGQTDGSAVLSSDVCPRRPTPPRRCCAFWCRSPGWPPSPSSRHDGRNPGSADVITVCYRDVVRSYPKAGGSLRGEPGQLRPQRRGDRRRHAAISYTITVAVSVAAGGTPSSPPCPPWAGRRGCPWR